MTLCEWDRRFASVIDSGLFHVYHGAAQQQYVAGLAHVIEPGGRLFLLSFNDDPANPGGGVSKKELYDAFAEGWEIESLESPCDCGNELNPAYVAAFPNEYPEGGWKMMFAVIRRKENI
jgi:hypothetical protein